MARRFSLDRLIHLLPLLIGTGLLVFAATATVSQVTFWASAAATEARVVEMQTRTSRDSDGKDSSEFYPVFEFTLPEGRVMRARSRWGSGSPCCEVGEVVRVLYDPARPERVARDSFADTWLSPLLLTVFGTVTFAGGLAIWCALGREDTAPAQRARDVARVAGVRRTETPDGTRWIVQARLDDPLTGAERIFESHPLRFDPTAQLRTPGTVPVEYDRDPRGDFRMDLRALRPPKEQVLPPPAAPARAADRNVTRLNSVAMDGSEPVDRSLPRTLIGIGAAFLLGAVAMAWPQVAHRIGAASAPGLVVDMRIGSSGYAPVFTFTPQGGQELRVVSPIFSHPPCCRIGDAVTVRYRPEDPRRARIASLQDDWFFPGILTGFALLWLLPGLMALRARWIFLRRGRIGGGRRAAGAGGSDARARRPGSARGVAVGGDARRPALVRSGALERSDAWRDAAAGERASGLRPRSADEYADERARDLRRRPGARPLPDGPVLPSHAGVAGRVGAGDVSEA